MSAGQRWNFAAVLGAAASELQAQVSSRSGRNLTDPAMKDAIGHVDAALAELGLAVAGLATAEDHEEDDGATP